LKQQARAAELLAEQEIATKQAKVTAATAERQHRELARHLAQLNLEADKIGIRVR
jgi:hypothetical protein